MSVVTHNASPPWKSPAWAMWGAALILPYLLIFGVFVVYPVLYGFSLGLNPKSYVDLWNDSVFFIAVKNTLFFLLIAVNFKFLLALLLSGFFVQQRPLVQVVLFLFLLPWAMPSIPTILSLRFFLNPEWGMLNTQLYKFFLIDGPNWLNEKNLAFGSAMFVHIWKSLPFWTLILITGRLAISKDLYEAASVDGATRLQQFKHITWPSLATLYISSTILSMIWTLGDFNSVYLMTGGGPADKTHVLATLGVRYLRIDKLDLGVAAIITAMPLILPLIYYMVKRLSKGVSDE